MDKIDQEIAQQPDALEKLRTFYFHGKGKELLESLPQHPTPLFTGMGASYHAAAIAAMQCQFSALPAIGVETVDLLRVSSKLLNKFAPLIYVSQSGESGEVALFLRRVEEGPLISVTNDEQSTLALSSTQVMPLLAGEETLIASKTYLNSLALLWLMNRRFCGAWDGTEESQLKKVTHRVQVMLAGKVSILKAWQDVLDGVQRLIFTGQGPQGISARQGAMVMAEWAKKQVQFISLGGLRHGFIELSEPGLGVVIFANSTNGLLSELDLANELDGYGVNVLLVIDGMPRRLREDPPPPVGFDPFLSTILDAVPPQLWAIEHSKAVKDGSGFRHIKKVTRRIKKISN